MSWSVFCTLAGVRLEGHAVPGTVLCFFPGTVVRTPGTPDSQNTDSQFFSTVSSPLPSLHFLIFSPSLCASPNFLLTLPPPPPPPPPPHSRFVPLIPVQYLPPHLKHLPNFPDISRGNPYLMSRTDSSVIDANNYRMEVRYNSMCKR